MGRVFRAQDEKDGSIVALKLLLAEGMQSRFIRRMKREAQALSRLDHPNVVRFHGFFARDGELYFVMDFVEGSTLGDRIRSRWVDPGGGMAVEEALSIARDLARALVHAHEQRIWHRDLKPENVLLHGDGRAILTDFGLAKVEDLTALTAQGKLLGTVLYLPPEQMLGQTLDGRADLYQLALLLYEMLTGQLPLAEENAILSAQRRIQEAIPPPSTLRPDLPPWLDAFLLRNLEVDRRKRDVDGESFLAAFEEGSSPPIAGLPSGAETELPTEDEAAALPGPPAPPPSFVEGGLGRFGGKTLFLLALLATSSLVGTLLGAWWLMGKTLPWSAKAGPPSTSPIRVPSPRAGAAPPRTTVPVLRHFTLFVEDGELAGAYDSLRVDEGGNPIDSEGRAGWLRLRNGPELRKEGGHWIEEPRGMVYLGGRRIRLGLSGGDRQGEVSETGLCRAENVSPGWYARDWRFEAPRGNDRRIAHHRFVAGEGMWLPRYRYKRRDLPWSEGFRSRRSGPEALFARLLGKRERGSFLKLFGAGRRISPTLVFGDVSSRCPSVGLFLREDGAGGETRELGVLPPLSSLSEVLRLRSSRAGTEDPWGGWAESLPVTFFPGRGGVQRAEGLSGAELLGRLSLSSHWLQKEAARGEGDGWRFLDLVARVPTTWLPPSDGRAVDGKALFPLCESSEGGAYWRDVAMRIRRGGELDPEARREVWMPVEQFLRGDAGPAFLEALWTHYREVATQAAYERPFNEHGLLLRDGDLPRPEDCETLWDGLGRAMGGKFRELFGDSGFLPADLDRLRAASALSGLPLVGDLGVDLRAASRALLPSRLEAWLDAIDLPKETGEGFLRSHGSGGDLRVEGWIRIEGTLVLPASRIVGSGVLVADRLRIEGDVFKRGPDERPPALVALKAPITFAESVHRIEALLVSCSGRQSLPEAPFFLRGGLAVRRLHVESLSVGGMRDIEYDRHLKEAP